ncbi:MAG: hypothetical protein QOK25_615 [Thermoleophilaceae bacterium]|nr:hypothetical protein [Thermoleophilaceae bacterium]
MLRAFLGEKMAAGARTAYRGKVGLALSGGGFRASLFHIGVLARLAELDVLREVEVLSCVSGGSIVGAHWYLQVRELLRAPRPEFLDADGAIKREAYIKLVEETADAFVRGVKSNMRLRAIGATGHNVRSIFDPAVTRTTRLGQLYESELYAQVRDGTAPEDERYISKLYIEPGDETGERPFSPRADNWHRRDKVPILVLNATTLNSGHNWQFTASWMGEPASGMDEDVDPAPRLRRVPYDSANRQVRLGDAVAASACVPGLFEPLMLADLYRDDSADRGERDWTVGLVDGGVHDNEGTDSLLTEDCGVIVVSDASGQKKPKKTAGQAILGVLLRTTGILKARVREAEWRELEARREAGSLQGLAYVHLRKDLDSPAVPWVGASRWEPLDDAPPPSTPPGAAPPREGMTYYGVRKDVQDLLAEIRTDLDSFTEMEAYALMTSGYLMTKERFGRGVADLRRSAPSEAWRFLAVRDQMCDPDLEPRELKAVLRAGKSLWLKPWILSAPLRRASVPLALVLVPLLLVLSIVALGMAAGVGVALGVANLASAIGRWRRHARAPERKTSVPDAVQRVVLGSLLATAGSVVAWAYMRLFDPHYLDAGRVGARRG